MKLANLRKVLVYLFYCLALALPLSFEFKFTEKLELTLFSEPIMAIITILLPVYFFKYIGFKKLSLLDKLVLIYLVATLLSVLFSVNKITSLKYFITISWITASGYFLPRFIQFTRTEWKKAVLLFLIGVSTLGVYVLYQHTQLGIFNQSSYMVARPFIYQGHTNLTAIIEPTLLIVLFLLFYHYPKNKSYISYILFVVFIFIIDFSCSRASFITTLIILAAFFMLLPLRRKVGFALLVVCTVVSSYWIRYANDYYHENYVRQPLKAYNPADRTTWKGTTTYSIPIDDDEVIKYREEHDGALVYEEALKELQQSKSLDKKHDSTVVEVKDTTPISSLRKNKDTRKTEEPLVARKPQMVDSTTLNNRHIAKQKNTNTSAENTAPEEVVIEGKSTNEIFALTTEERQNRAPISKTNKELDILNFDNNHSNIERMNRWKAGIHFFKDHPVFGIGVGTFSDFYLTDYYGKGLVDKETVVSSKKMNIHNLYLGWFTEGGFLLGLSGLVLMFFIFRPQLKPLFKHGFTLKSIKQYFSKLIIIKGLILLYFASFLLHGVVQDFANEPRVAVIFWAVVSTLNLYSNNGRLFKTAGKQG